MLLDQFGEFGQWRQAGLGAALVDVGCIFEGAGLPFAGVGMRHHRRT